MGTTPHGLPYPENTGLLNQGDDAIKALAEALDARGLGLTFQTDLWALNGGAAGAPTDWVGTFKVPFTATPTVFMTSTSGFLVGAKPGGITPTKVTGFAWNPLTKDWVAGPHYITYLAIGPI